MARSCQRADCVRDQSPYYFALQRYPCARTARAAQRTCSLPIPSSVATPRSRTAATGTRPLDKLPPDKRVVVRRAYPVGAAQIPAQSQPFLGPLQGSCGSAVLGCSPSVKSAARGGAASKGRSGARETLTPFGASVSHGRQGLRLCEKCKVAG